MTEYIRKEVVPAISSALNSPDMENQLTQFAGKVVTILAKALVIGLNAAIEGALPTWLRGNLMDRIQGPERAPLAVTGKGGEVELGSDVRSYGSGGVVPGPYGKPQHVIAHSGERFLGMGNTSEWVGGSSGGSLMPPSVSVEFHGTVGMDPSDVREAVRQGVLTGWMQGMEQMAAAQGVQR